jgi:hypothetical protein
MIDTGKQMHALATRQHSPAKLSSDNPLFGFDRGQAANCSSTLVPGTLPVRVSALTDHELIHQA